MATIIHNESILLDIQNDIDKVIKEVGEEALSRVKDRTPVRTGYAQSRWEMTSDDQGFTLENDAEYISYLELGWSDQAPAGMLGITMVEVPDIVDDVVSRHRKD